MANNIYQVAVSNSLLLGNFYSFVKLTDLLPKGDHGIGCFHNLDGEMILIDNEFYQLKADGVANKAAPDATAPFAVVVKLQPTHELIIPNEMTFEEYKAFVESSIPENNHPLSIRVDGEFELMHYRSVPAQTPPYPTLAEVASKQPEFKRQSIKGSIVGFRYPKYFTGINLPGYHLHFIDDGRTTGGHILDFKIKSGTVKMALANEVTISMPNDEEFCKANLENKK